MEQLKAMATVSAGIELPLDPAAAFEAVTCELVSALRARGIVADAAPDGTVRERDAVIGRIVEWVPADRVVIEWRPADWNADEVTQIALRFEPATEGTRVTLEHGGWGGLIGDPRELAGWFAGQVAAPLLTATAPAAFGDWLTDRLARRPSGASARATYRDPLYHYPNFRVILAELALRPDDYLLEVGCGGGALLKSALRSGCRAAAVDHSPDMVQLARTENADAVASGRLDIVEANADSLPFADGTFTCATMTGVLGFLPRPVAALAEMRRVLASGGRIVILGSDPELRGTPAAPEPMASRLRFYDDEALAALGRDAGLAEVRVVRRDLEPFARESGVPEEHVPLFAGVTRFLLARKR
jgi:SAM-dependent methyltransferase